jgi:YidC/Oxa1 family membrane protein insertase
MIGLLFEGPAWLLAKFYEFSGDYTIAISLIALVVMIITAPLQLKATKGMLEMQRLQPQLRKLQNEHRGDRQKLNEEMMKLYQQHKVNPMASCFPLLLQFPVFIIMFQVLHGLTREVNCAATDLSPVAADLCASNPGAAKVFYPDFVSNTSQIYLDLAGQTEMKSFGLDLAKRPFEVLGESFGLGLIYVGLVIVLGLLYLVQQKMVAARATINPSMSPMQQKIFQYLPVVFAVFLVFYLTGLVIYYMAQAVFRIGLQWYITKRFYKGDESLGRQAQRAGEEAREIAKADGGGGGMFGQMKRDLAQAKEPPASKSKPASGKPSTSGPTTSKRVTPPKNRPTPSGKSATKPTPGRPSPRPKQK